MQTQTPISDRPGDIYAALIADLALLRMNVSDEDLITEAVATNYAQVAPATKKRYGKHLEHFAAYLHSACAGSVTFYTCKEKHVLRYMEHLAAKGGPNPAAERACCAWCNVNGYPDGRAGHGWSDSYRKSHLAAIGYLYTHFYRDDDLPSHDPSSRVKAPKVKVVPQYAPDRSEIRAMLDAPGRPKDRLLAYWTFYAPSRRKTFSDALWKSLDLERGTWHVVGKGGKADCFDLHPLLVRELRRYRRWQLEQYAVTHAAVRDALCFEDTAYVLLTCNGKRTCPQAITKMLKWRAVRAGVSVKASVSAFDSPSGKTSKLSCHAMRRGWAQAAIEDGVPITTIQDVLKHDDISTTRRHYAFGKPPLATAALRGMRV